MFKGHSVKITERDDKDKTIDFFYMIFFLLKQLNLQHLNFELQ